MKVFHGEGILPKKADAIAKALGVSDYLELVEREVEHHPSDEGHNMSGFGAMAAAKSAWSPFASMPGIHQ